jgi:hypothetical protein
MNREDEIAAVKLVGEKIGYGNMMYIASALWRRSMRKKGYPTSGVFFPVLPDEKDPDMVREMYHADDELDKLLGS